MQGVQFISAVILLSEDPTKLAGFYTNGLGLPLEASDHGGSEGDHFECELGDVHFAIHRASERPADTSDRAASRQNVKIAFAVRDLKAALGKLSEMKVLPIYDPVHRGFAKMTAVRDWDGNIVELTELSDSWLRHLAARKPAERDVVTSCSRIDSTGD